MRRLSPSEKLAVGGTALAVVGTLLPWLSFEDVSEIGFFIDGFMALMFALPVLGVLALWEWGRFQQAAVVLLGGLTAVVAGRYALEVGAPATGVGAYVVFVAGVLIAGAGLLGLVRGRQRASGGVEEGPDAE